MSLLEELQQALGSTYIIERELGGGGMSRVFVGEEIALGRKVAVKVLLPELAAGVSADRFQREIKLAAQLQHPNIVPVITTGVAAGLPYYTMPFVDGLSLRKRLERNPGVPIVEAVGILKDVSRALAYAHDRGIVHRDIKPENVLLADEAAVVTDFGIAKALAASRTDAPGGTLTQAGTSLGTPAYMAPEQISADPHVDHRADIYSFGCVAYELFSGVAPFADRLPHQLYAAHIAEKPVSLKERRTDCPDSIAELVMQCLEKDPTNRPQTARALLRAFEGGAVSGQVSGSGNSYQQPAIRNQQSGNRQNRKALVGAAIVGMALIVAVGAYATKDKKAESADIHSLAVLPFTNIGGDTANAYFADGMSDELTTELARVPGLTLASRSSIARLKGQETKQIAQALNVGGIIDGTVRRAGDRLRLTAQLVDASSGNIVWTDSYEQKAEDVFAMQDSITKAIVAALRVKLTGGAEVAGANAQGTKDPVAYDAYLQGRYLFAQRRSLHHALELFDQATHLDPKFARAYAGYAMAGSLLTSYGPGKVDSILPLAIKAGEKAVALDPNLADGHLGLANSLIFDLKWSEAEAHLKKAVELEPSNATAHQWYGDILYARGRSIDALPHVKRALQLDPSSPVINNDYAYALMLAGKLDESETTFKKAMDLDPSFPYGRLNLMVVAVLKKQYDSVHVYAAGASQPLGSIVQLSAYLDAGDTAKARAMRSHVLSLIDAKDADPDGISHVFYYEAIGDADSMFIALNHAIDGKNSFFATQGSLPCDPRLTRYRSDPRFALALRRLKVERCQTESAAGR